MVDDRSEYFREYYLANKDAINLKKRMRRIGSPRDEPVPWRTNLRKANRKYMNANRRYIRFAHRFKMGVPEARDLLKMLDVAIAILSTPIAGPVTYENGVFISTNGPQPGVSSMKWITNGRQDGDGGSTTHIRKETEKRDMSADRPATVGNINRRYTYTWKLKGGLGGARPLQSIRWSIIATGMSLTAGASIYDGRRRRLIVERPLNLDVGAANGGSANE